VLAFPEAGLDDTAAYQGYQTRLFRDAAGNTVQVYLDARQGRTVHVLADAENESAGFTARDAAGRPAALRWDGPTAGVSRRGRARVLEYRVSAPGPSVAVGQWVLGSMRVERDFQYERSQGRGNAAMAGPAYPVPRSTRSSPRWGGSTRPSGVGTWRWCARPTSRRSGPAPGRRSRHAPRAGRGWRAWSSRRSTGATRSRSSSSPTRARRRARGRGLGGPPGARGRRVAAVPFVVRVVTTGARSRRSAAPRSSAPSSSASSTRPAATRAAASCERQALGVELLASREKLMAGLPTYATYFGRDLMVSALMMRDVWRPEVLEAVVAACCATSRPTAR
jgi:hypothetical protein